MSDPRQLLDAYAAKYQVTRGQREAHAPEAFAALRAVLDLCAEMDKRDGWDWRHEQAFASDIEAAITSALEAP